MSTFLSITTEKNLEEYAGYDFPGSKERMQSNSNAENKLQFNQFQSEYQTFFISRERSFEEEFKSEIEKFHEIRQNISVLIIVGSTFQIISEPLYDGLFQKDAEDLSTALLIRHLFHFAFGIPYSQILITSTQEKNFTNLDNKTDLISSPTQFYEEISDKKPNLKYKFKLKEINEFGFYQSINIAQIGTHQFKFFFQESYGDVIKPFNIEIIKDFKNFSNENTHLFVFFLNHGFIGQFAGFPYQFFIERLLKIDCKRFYICNDSCRSGSMIELIKICQEFKQIFPNEYDLEIESVLFNFLTGLGKFEKENFRKIVDEKIKYFDFGKISQETIANFKLKLADMDEETIYKISQFINNLDSQFSDEKCVPQHFLKFSEKAIIFTSSSYDQDSISLPGREINMSILEDPITRVFGNIFSSIFIESLLDKKSQKSLDDFSASIINLFHKYREDFEGYVKEQNLPIQGKTVNDTLFTSKEIEAFFTYKKNERFYVFDENCDWPDLNSIRLDEKFWNVDISKVNEEEYNNVHFCIFKTSSSADQQISNPNNYGPIKGEYYSIKYKKDFEKAVNLLHEKNDTKESFSVFITMKNANVLQEKCDGFGKFIGKIKPINTNFARVLGSLKNPIVNFFINNPNNVNRDASYFVEAYKSIEPFWQNYDI